LHAFNFLKGNSTSVAEQKGQASYCKRPKTSVSCFHRHRGLYILFNNPYLTNC